MINALIGQKINQAQDFLENGKRIPVTEIALTDNVVLQVKTQDKDAYSAVQLGAGTKKKPINAVLGHAKKAGQKTASLTIKEVLVKDSSAEDAPKVGDSVSVYTVFKPGDSVTVTATSKGKGFAGGVKRHGFRGGPKTHGQSDRHRAPGSIGQGTTPGRVYKGKRMAGRMGSDTVTVSNLTVVDVDTEAKKLFVSGLVPGHKNAWLVVTKTGENKKFVQLLSTKEKEEAKAAKEAAEVVVEAPAEEVKDATQPSLEASAGKEEAVTAPEETPLRSESSEGQAVQSAPEAPEEAVEAPTEAAEQDVKTEEKVKEVAIDEEVKEEDAAESDASKTAAAKGSGESKEENAS